jgi:hypothetical protein
MLHIGMSLTEIEGCRDLVATAVAAVAPELGTRQRATAARVHRVSATRPRESVRCTTFV